MSKAFTYMVVAIMGLVLLIFTASRTLDLLQTFLPSGQSSAFAYLGLVAFDGGLLGWSFFFAHGARGHWQRAIALLMVILSLVAVSVSTMSDLYIGGASKGLLTTLSQGQRLAILLAVAGVICANVTAFFLVHISDPDRMRAMASESARDVIHAEALRQIHAAAPIVASQVAPQMTRQWVVDTIQQLLPGATWQGEQPVMQIPSPAPVVNAAPVQQQPAPAKPKRGGLWGWFAKEPPVQQSAAVQQMPVAPVQQPIMPDKLAITIEAITDHPDITDDDLAEVLELKKPASARYWRLKAQEFLRASGTPTVKLPAVSLQPGGSNGSKATQANS